MTLRDDVAKLRAITGSEWPLLKDPWAELDELRHGPRKESRMTSQQVDDVKDVLTAGDDLVHSIIQDYPAKAAEVQDFMAALAAWAEGNPVPE